ncbi:MAG TPA: hypothetical protein VGJ16_00680, partial [Pirellulales bacterium]
MSQTANPSPFRAFEFRLFKFLSSFGCRVSCLAAITTLIGPLLTSPAIAQLRDSFEGPQPTWSLKAGDCGVRV